MTKDDAKFLLQFVEDRKWQRARTRPWNPHEYTIRDWPEGKGGGDVEDFDRFIALIYSDGFSAKWGPRTWPYLEIGDYCYFTYGYPPGETTVLNRKPSENVKGDRDAEPWGDRGPVDDQPQD